MPPPFKSDPLLPTQAILLHIDRTLRVHPLSFLCIASCCSTRWSVADGRGVPAAAELFPAGSSLSRSSPYSLLLSDRTSDTGTRGINDCEIQSLIHGPEQLTSSAISAREAERSESALSLLLAGFKIHALLLSADRYLRTVAILCCLLSPRRPICDSRLQISISYCFPSCLTTSFAHIAEETQI